MKWMILWAVFFSMSIGTVLIMGCGEENGVDLSPEEIVRDYFQFVNEERFDEFFDLFDPDVEFQAPPNFCTKGVENVEPYYRTLLAFAPYHLDTPLHINVSGNRVAVFIQAEMGLEDGRMFSIKASDWFTIDKGKIKSLHIFFDLFSLSATTPNVEYLY